MSTIIIHPIVEKIKYSSKERFKYITWNLYNTFMSFINQNCGGIKTIKEYNSTTITHVEEINIDFETLIDDKFANNMYKDAVFPIIRVTTEIQKKEWDKPLVFTDCTRLLENMDPNIVKLYRDKNIWLNHNGSQCENGIAYDTFIVPTVKYGKLKCGTLYDFSDYKNSKVMMNLEVKPKIIITAPENFIFESKLYC